jgi:hypothetical protein
MPRSSKWSFSLIFPHQNPVCPLVSPMLRLYPVCAVNWKTKNWYNWSNQ